MDFTHFACFRNDRRSINETIIVREIVDSVVDKHFAQGYLNMGSEKYKSIIMDILRQYQSSLELTDLNFGKNWSDKRIEKFKEDLSKVTENLITYTTET
jgi:polyhydroxyalkanoate synthesis regulator phasin